MTLLRAFGFVRYTSAKVTPYILPLMQHSCSFSSSMDDFGPLLPLLEVAKVTE